MSKQNQPEHKGKVNNNFTLADWNTIPEQLIYDAVTKEGKVIIARTLGIKEASFRDWFKVRKIDIPIVRNANYYNARKPLEEQGAWEDELSKQILALMEEARSKRLKKHEEDNAYITVICPTCSKAFETPRNNPQKYCSASCVSNRIRSDEEKAKLSESCTGREAWNKGRKCTKEERERMSKASKEFWAKEGFKNKMSEIQKESWSNQELLNKHSQIMIESNNRPTVRQKIKEGLEEYYTHVDQQILTDRYIKQMQTKEQNGTLYMSSGEIEIINFLKEYGFNPKKYISGQGETRFEIDIYIPEKKIGIEFNGVYYHSHNGINHRSKTYHAKKSIEADKLGIDLIHIWEDQWKNQREIIKDILLARLGILDNNQIYARKCEIRDVPTADYRDFCDKYHIQGYRAASVKLGLYYNDKLVQIASFNKARGYGNSSSSLKYEWEWIRGCISSNNKVIGGTSKLLKYFIKTYNPNNILCFSDWNLFSGKGYKEAGFVFEGYTSPDKFYVTPGKKLVRINRNPYAYQQYKSMVDKGELFECYGCGSKKFVWYKD